MMGLLVFKEKLKQLYGKYNRYMIPAVKFLLGALAFFLISSNVGFMARLKNPLVPVVMGLVAAVVPCGVTAFFAGCFLIAHVSQVSLEAALIIAVFMLVIMMLYYGFRPGDGYLLLLTPMMFFLRVPYVIPLFVGLSGSLVSIVPVSCGVCIYYIMMYLKQNAGVLAGSSMSEMAERFIVIVQSLFGNQLMWVMAAAFAAGVLVVFLIRNLSVDYSCSIAIIGDFYFNLPVAIGPMILGILVSVALALVYQFFVFAVDYTRTEYLQYQDDDYYYYVKAVPKITVSQPDVKVHRISSRKSSRHEKSN